MIIFVTFVSELKMKTRVWCYFHWFWGEIHGMPAKKK